MNEGVNKSEEVTKKKKSSFWKVIIFIFLLILFAVGGWFGNMYYQKYLEKKDTTDKTNKNKDNKENKEKVEEEKEEELDTKSDLVQKLYNKVTIYDEGKKADCHKNWIYGNKDEFDVASETDEVKLNLVAINMEDVKKGTDLFSSIDIPSSMENYSNDCTFLNGSDMQVYFTKDYIQTLYRDIYGKDATFDSSAYISANLVRYYPVGDKYYKYTAIGGNVCGPVDYIDTISKALKVGKEIKIYETENYIEEGKDAVISNYVYTFSKQDDDTYVFVSRKKS